MPLDFGVSFPLDGIKRDLYDLWKAQQARIEAIPYTPPTRWQRLRWWVRDHTPHVHLGPCDHSECGW